MSLRSTYRRLYMKCTSLSILWQGNRRYTRRLYKVWSVFYDLGLRSDPAYRRTGERMVRGVVHKSDRVLDVGTGTGFLIEFGAPLASEYVGLDYTGAMLKKAALKIAKWRYPNVALRWGDAVELLLPDASFDAAVSSFMLAHLPPPSRRRALAEIFRVLKPGGRLGLCQAQGEQFPLFSSREEMQGHLEAIGFGHIEFIDNDDVFRTVTAVKPAAG
ncbi:MAG: class I SAM-dependent methyltransferase [Deltaproteobacteria bacterium]|nr:class I SAM-dependent methyltransferase [Deltaproteobacteria bacterium]